ncbi:VanZ family protein [Microbacterium sp. 179-I 3D3 NHS]|uniref:VanZ family protein n=1 Tax=unclassified Microbacterium TaxID=2609290 RepID=UPI0039A0EA53
MGSLLPPPRRLTRAWAAALGIPFLVGLGLLTLTPSRVESAMPSIVDLTLAAIRRLGWTSLDFDRVEVMANVLVFVPVGALAFVLLPRRIGLLALLVGPLLSLGVESTQKLMLPHRAATVSDVIANSIGATGGVLLAVLCTLLFARPRIPHPAPTPEAS